MSEKIVQLNEEVIKGQLKELVRGLHRRDAERTSEMMPDRATAAGTTTGT